MLGLRFRLLPRDRNRCPRRERDVDLRILSRDVAHCHSKEQAHRNRSLSREKPSAKAHKPLNLMSLNITPRFPGHHCLFIVERTSVWGHWSSSSACSLVCQLTQNFYQLCLLIHPATGAALESYESIFRNQESRIYRAFHRFELFRALSDRSVLTPRSRNPKA